MLNIDANIEAKLSSCISSCRRKRRLVHAGIPSTKEMFMSVYVLVAVVGAINLLNENVNVDMIRQHPLHLREYDVQHRVVDAIRVLHNLLHWLLANLARIFQDSRPSSRQEVGPLWKACEPGTTWCGLLQPHHLVYLKCHFVEAKVEILACLLKENYGWCRWSHMSRWRRRMDGGQCWQVQDCGLLMLGGILRSVRCSPRESQKWNVSSSRVW